MNSADPFSAVFGARRGACVASGGNPLEACGTCSERPARNERLFTFQLGGTGETLTECWECYMLSYLRCRDCWRIFVATDMYGCLCENCLENHPGYPDECDCEGCEWERNGWPLSTYEDVEDDFARPRGSLR
jgi:hypothetical protein